MEFTAIRTPGIGFAIHYYPKQHGLKRSLMIHFLIWELSIDWGNGW